MTECLPLIHLYRVLEGTAFSLEQLMFAITMGWADNTVKIGQQFG